MGSVVCLVPLCVRQEQRKMLGLEVIVLCLLFGALTHGQTTECQSECHKSEPLLLLSHSNMLCKYMNTVLVT